MRTAAGADLAPVPHCAEYGTKSGWTLEAMQNRWSPVPDLYVGLVVLRCYLLLATVAVVVKLVRLAEG